MNQLGQHNQQNQDPASYHWRTLSLLQAVLDRQAVPDLTEVPGPTVVPNLIQSREIVRERRLTLGALAVKHDRVFNLAYLIDQHLLRVAGEKLRASAAPGVDNVTARTYRRDLSLNITKLHKEVLHKTYQPSPNRRVSIKKDDGSERHLGLPTTREKHLQRAVMILLEAICEPNFYKHSYGFRPRRSARKAVKVLRTWLADRKNTWILEIDLSKFFDTIPHDMLIQVLSEKIGDPVVMKLLKLWLKAGVVVNGDVIHSDRGTPQGGVISPLMANVYLDKVLDQWLTRTYFPTLKGKALHVRYADDFIVAFTHEDECRKALVDITTRLEAFGLTVNQLKTKITCMTCPGPSRVPQAPMSEFSFLGFTYYWTPCPETGWDLRIRTSEKSMKRFMDNLSTWISDVNTQTGEIPLGELRAKLKGHMDYFNTVGINSPQAPRVGQVDAADALPGGADSAGLHNRQIDVPPGERDIPCIQTDIKTSRTITK